ncbi:MAG TPA: dephospho-CoA kinase [Thermoleophilaceae bacterium]|nr:dephospho-CoA kinase [Thermoleophilaceae bacterium]
MSSGRVPFLGLTGGLGAGKSEALRALSELGAATLSSDAVVHELLATDELRDAIVERLGPEMAPGGEVDRSKVAERVFDDPEQREWLEGLLWPLVGERIAEWRALQDAAEPAPRVAVVEVPLLFEAGIEALFDHTLAVLANESVREERAAARGHAALASRAGRQLSQGQKAQRADFVVRNDGTLDELKHTLSRVLANIEGQ